MASVHVQINEGWATNELYVVWEALEEGDEEMWFTDLFLCLCETCVQEVDRCCAVQDPEEMKKDESWLLIVWSFYSTGMKGAFKF